MSGTNEVLITSEASGQLWNTCISEPHSGTTLMTFKGGATSARTLSLLGNDYILGGVSHKPLIHVWALHRKDQRQLRIVCPGRVTALATSPDGGYCAAAIDDKIHVWQTSTGHLLAVLTRHYQAVRCLQFTDDGSHFISGGDDNIVAVWALSALLASSRGQAVPSGIEPRWLWTSHSLPVTDMHVGYGGLLSRVATVSQDRTCRIWEIRSGQLLCTMVFDNSLSSVVMDNAESRLFVGSFTGDIYQVNLFEQPVQLERHVSSETEGSLVFRGHSKQVNCLGISMDGTVLASGSNDCSVKLWDVPSRQCVRTLTHKGMVTNVLFVPTPRGLLSTESRPMLPLQQFQRHLYSESESKRDTLSVRLRKRKVDDAGYICEQIVGEECREELHKANHSQEPSAEEVQDNLQKQVKKLAAANRDIFKYAVNVILKDKK